MSKHVMIGLWPSANRAQITQSPLMYAVAVDIVVDNRDIVKLLINKEADVNAQDNRGYTPLYWAAMLGSKDLVELLIAQGADINAKDKHGKTALSLAKEKGFNEIVELLRKHGAKE